MESLIQEYITRSTSLEDDLNMKKEMLLKRRLSPYATLRPGDLAALLRLHTSLQFSAFPSKHGPSNRDVDGHCPPKAILENQELDRISDDRDDDDSGTQDDFIDVECRGADHNHIPTEYLVTDLRRHEMPVIGVCVDNRICPGFRYRVRRIGTDNFLYGNEAKTLVSIGMGYGRRLTFTGDSLNFNDCYFWSDSEPRGFAFNIHAVDVGQQLSILDTNGMVVGEGVVKNVHDRQEELFTEIDQTGNVIKRVHVRLLYSVKYHQRHSHGLVELMPTENVETNSGEAIVSRRKGSRKAFLVAIENVFLPRLGQCKLVPGV